MGSGLLWYKLTRRVSQAYRGGGGIHDILAMRTDMQAPAAQAGRPGNAICGDPCSSVLGGLGSPVVQADKEDITGC